MEFYLHDSASLFQFQLKGRLEGRWVEELEHAWRTAQSVMEGKELVVDITEMTAADGAGMALLERMRASGARLAPEAAVIRSAGSRLRAERASYAG
ncbi:MAG TPA: hypothetical protein VFA33_08090 [Bryobacteraceae bacterium]|nr:hypothetical protein [Bryobacteraceae bacterium]